MAIPYSNCFQLSKISSKSCPVRSPTRLGNQASPVYACLQNLDPALRLGAKVNAISTAVPAADYSMDIELSSLTALCPLDGRYWTTRPKSKNCTCKNQNVIPHKL